MRPSRWSLARVPPAEPPTLVVSVDEVAAHMRAGIDEYGQIERRIMAATRMAEARTGRSLLTQRWRLVLDDWPATGIIELRRPPLQAVETIEYIAADDIPAVWPPTEYVVDADDLLGRVVPASPARFPALGDGISRVQVLYRAGYGDAPAAVPEPIRQWVTIMAATLHEHRESVVVGVASTTAVATMPFVDRLLDPYRVRMYGS